MAVYFEVIKNPYYNYDFPRLARITADKIAGLLGEGWTVTDLNPPSTGDLRSYEKISSPDYSTTFEVYRYYPSVNVILQIRAFYQLYPWTNSKAVQMVGELILDPTYKSFNIAVFKNNNGDFSLTGYELASGESQPAAIEFNNLIVRNSQGKDVFLAVYRSSIPPMINYAFDGSNGFDKDYEVIISTDVKNSGKEMFARVNDVLYGGYLSDVYLIENLQTEVKTDVQTINGVQYRLIGARTKGDIGLAVPND